MGTTFINSIPAELVKHVTAACGERGVLWLDKLEHTIRGLENKWSIKVQRPFPTIEYNYVAPAIGPKGENVVLKIAPPWIPIEIFGEANYLRSRDGDRCVRLLAEDGDSRAILIERVFPGKSLTECFEDRKLDAVSPAIKVLEAIIRPSPIEGNVAPLDRWVEGVRNHHSTDFPSSYAGKALDIYDRLSRQAGQTFYLHGDFHPGNVVSSDVCDFKAIDPKGVIGHVGFEIATFLNNFYWWQESEPKIREILAVATGQFSDAFDIDAIELRQWAFAQMVFTAWWTFDDMPELYDGGVVKADIWDL